MGWLIFIITAILVIILLIKAVGYENKKKDVRAELISNKLAGIENFTISRRIDGFGGFYIFAIDEKNEKIGFVSLIERCAYNFSDIIGVELIEDGNTISKKSTSRTIGGALVGGVLTGGVGAIIGGLSGGSTQKNKVSSLSVKIHLRNLNKPSLLIKCFDSMSMTGYASIETDGNLQSSIYKLGKMHADNIKDLVSVIIDKTDKNSTTTSEEIVAKPSGSIADELLKMNELKEKGIITEAEFIIQKTKLLSK